MELKKVDFSHKFEIPKRNEFKVLFNTFKQNYSPIALQNIIQIK